MGGWGNVCPVPTNTRENNDAAFVRGFPAPPRDILNHGGNAPHHENNVQLLREYRCADHFFTVQVCAPCAKAGRNSHLATVFSSRHITKKPQKAPHYITVFGAPDPNRLYVLRISKNWGGWLTHAADCTDHPTPLEPADVRW